MSDSEREELLNQIDFSRVNEDTISICKENKLIPQKLITEASLSLCVKLRRQLDEARSRLRVAEHELSKTRVASGLSSKTKTTTTTKKKKNNVRFDFLFQLIDLDNTKQRHE